MTGDAATEVGAVVGDDQRRYFDAYGHIILRGMFADQVAELSDAFDEVFANPDQPRMTMNIIGHRWRPRVAIGEFVEIHPRLAELISHPRLLGAARDLLGEGARYSCSDGAVYHCETEWHYDTPSEDVDRRHVKFAFYLEPLSGDSGAPRVLPGSHLMNRAYRGGPLEPYLGFEGETERRTGYAAEDLPHWALSSEPGDVVVWDFRVLHSSFGRTEPRRKFALNFCSGPEADPVEHAYIRLKAEEEAAEAAAAAASDTDAPAATPPQARRTAPGPTPTSVRWARRARRVAGRTARRLHRTS